MQTRAWILNTIFNLARIGDIVRGKTPIEKFRDYDDSGELDEQTLNLYYFIWLGLVGVVIILDILCCKYREIARLFFSIEMIILTLFHSLPGETFLLNETFELFFFFVILSFAFCFVCDPRLSLAILFIACCTQTILRD